MPPPRLHEAAWLFFRVGNTVFGGGDPTIAALQREFDRRQWLDPDRFSVAYGLARITPGTNMLAFCAGAGWFLRGNAGALAAVLAVTVPSAALAVWLTHLCAWGAGNPAGRAIVGATVAAAAGATAAAALRLVASQVSKAHWAWPVALAGCAFALARFAGLPPLAIIGMAALAGFLRPRP